MEAGSCVSEKISILGLGVYLGLIRNGYTEHMKSRDGAGPTSEMATAICPENVRLVVKRTTPTKCRRRTKSGISRMSTVKFGAERFYMLIQR